MTIHTEFTSTANAHCVPWLGDGTTTVVGARVTTQQVARTAQARRDRTPICWADAQAALAWPDRSRTTTAILVLVAVVAAV